MKVSEHRDETLTFEYFNTKIRGDIKLKKVSETGEGLAGAEFSIYKSTDTEFKIPIDTVTSNASGIVEFKGVEYGEYKIKETKAPIGYNLSDKVLDAEITTEGEVIDLIGDPVSNTKIRANIKILKRNKNTHAPLRNSTIALYTESGLLIDEKVTGNDGKVLFEDLEYGRYYYQETKSPAGYGLNSTKHYFNIENNDETLEMNLDNTRRPTRPDRPDPDPDPEDPPKEDPKEPEEAEEPQDPEDPEVPMDPEEPEPTDPQDPEPEDPQDPDPEETEDPEDPVEPLIPIVLDPPTKGTVTIDEDGNWTYTPRPGEKGKDSFTIVHPDGREELIEIDLDDLPLGTTSVKNGQPILPRTGKASDLGFYLGGMILIGLGIFLRKRTV